ncbi:MAG: hypothetical protein ACYC6Y_32090, partial [Thermoguttaceae bacterium]
MSDAKKLQPAGELPPELQALEARLASLQPAAEGLQRDRLMFEAGRAAAEAQRDRRSAGARRVRAAASMVLTAAATLVVASFVLRPGPVVINGAAERGQDAVEGPAGLRHGPLAVPAGELPSGGGHSAGSARSLAASPGVTVGGNGGLASSYFGDRDLLLAMGCEGPAEPKRSASGSGHSPARVSYMDLLGELEAEMRGSTSRSGRPEYLRL